MASSSASPERIAAIGLLLAGSLVPQPALAHSSLPGIEGFYSGLVHPLVSYHQLLALLGLGVMLGLGRTAWFGTAWPVFAAFAIVGMGTGLSGYLPADKTAGLLLIGFLAATMAAIHPPGIFVLSVFLSALAGIFYGFSSVPDAGPMRDMIITLFGSFVGANLLLVYVGGGLNWFRNRISGGWVNIASRIAAAWIATISVSMAALILSSH